MRRTTRFRFFMDVAVKLFGKNNFLAQILAIFLRLLYNSSNKNGKYLNFICNLRRKSLV